MNSETAGLKGDAVDIVVAVDCSASVVAVTGKYSNKHKQRPPVSQMGFKIFWEHQTITLFVNSEYKT